VYFLRVACRIFATTFIPIERLLSGCLTRPCGKIICELSVMDLSFQFGEFRRLVLYSLAREFYLRNPVAGADLILIKEIVFL
jgi:hypothetical protein